MSWGHSLSFLKGTKYIQNDYENLPYDCRHGWLFQEFSVEDMFPTGLIVRLHFAQIDS